MHPQHRKHALLTASALAACLVAGTIAFAQEKKEEEPFWAKGRPKGDVTAKMAPGRRAAGADAGGAAAEAQGPARLQGRGLPERHPRCARPAPRRQGHGVRQLAVRGRQDLCGHRREGQAHHQDHRRASSSCRTASSSTTARSTWRRPSRSRATTRSRTTSTARRSRSRCSTSCPATSRTAGSSSSSGPTASSTCPSARPATSASPIPRSTCRSSASMRMAAARRSSPAACATRWASTSTRAPRSCGSPTTSATGWPRTCRSTSSIASPTPARTTSAIPTAIPA